MNSITIVGGGWAGLITALLFHQKGVVVNGLEKSNQLGGSSGWVPYEKFLRAQSVEFLSQMGIQKTYELVQANAAERRKGNWITPETSVSSLLTSYLENSFYSRSASGAWLTGELIEKCGSFFKLNRQVTEIHHTERRIVFSDDTEEGYEKLVWCAGSQRLGRVLRPANQQLAKAIKGIPEAGSAFSVEFFGSTQWFPTTNSVVFPFRHRDEKLVAIGTETMHLSSEEKTLFRTQWTVFIDREIAEDREEVAKYVRTFKRELSKEFPELHKQFNEGKISFFPEIHGGGTATLASPLVADNLYFVGSEIACASESVQTTPWDRILSSCGQLVAEI